MRPSIVLFGDSITEEAFGEGGWGAHLANHYSRSADVVLRGYSGYNTRWAAMVAARAVVAGAAGAAAPPAAVTVCFGANDASLPGRASALQHVPLPEYRDNLRAICALLAAAWPSVVVILITPPPVHDAARVRYTQSLSSCINFIEDERVGRRVRARLRRGGGGVRAEGHRHLVQDAAIPRLGELILEGRAAPDAAREQGGVRGGGVRAQGRQPWPRSAPCRPAALLRHGSKQPRQVLRRMTHHRKKFALLI
ncbi:Os06g0156400 [Oryza sativa Japonica Group]|uniref:Os06g0156400 protein n=1 Tax=Oryza sativa subsp. japonica TaxID=39947 RepID=A0A0N7KLK1_ORYSJ|nr:hypothetical protein EE612_032030 [Oryza sativa]BAS96241.1 Os06g0156400 [Oryza sativa Japonica Group]